MTAKKAAIKSTLPEAVINAVRVRVNMLRDQVAQTNHHISYLTSEATKAQSELTDLVNHAKKSGVDLDSPTVKSAEAFSMGGMIGGGMAVVGEQSGAAPTPVQDKPKKAGPPKLTPEAQAARVAKMKATIAAKKAAKEATKADSGTGSGPVVPVTGNPELDQVLAGATSAAE